MATKQDALLYATEAEGNDAIETIVVLTVYKGGLATGCFASSYASATFVVNAVGHLLGFLLAEAAKNAQPAVGSSGAVQ
jgi:hypothetical protein